MEQSYVERSPLPQLSRLVRTVWTQSTGDRPYVQRHIPTGGVELHWPIGREPRVIAPMSRALVEVIPAHTTLVGVRFWPGPNPLLPIALSELVDDGVRLRDLGHRWIDEVGEAMVDAATLPAACAALQRRLIQQLMTWAAPDPLVSAGVRLLMPWQPVDVLTVATRLGLSASQLRRRFVGAVGTSPKALQRTLRFQGFLALAQAGVVPTVPRSGDGMAALAAEVGYADQSHLTRECARLTGVTPSTLLGGDVARCSCGHDHAASYRPFLAGRAVNDSSVIDARFVQDGAAPAFIT